jgi:ribosomal protein S18 acetylase RimI-like enzyme
MGSAIARKVRQMKPATADEPMLQVVPWADVVPGVAALAGRTPAAVQTQIDTFPTKIEGWAAVHGDTVVASGIRVQTPEGLALARLRGPAAKRLVTWVEAQTEGLLKVSLASAPGLGAWLAARGYRWIEAHLTMRRAAPYPEPAPLPPGFESVALDAVPLAHWLALHNETFIDVPGWVPLDAAGWARMTSDPQRADAVRLIRRGDALVGFWHVAHDPEDGPSVEALGVRAAARGLGLGRLLLRQAQRHLGTPTCALRVSESNAAALRLYQAEGYVAIDRRDEWARG